MRVVIADDAVLLREGLVRLVQENGWTVEAAVGDGPSLVAAIEEHRPDISIVDVRMPPSHTDEGLRAAVEARTRVPGTPILVLSQYVEVAYADDLLADRRGAVGYLLKDRVAEVADFLDALRQVAGGATILDPEVIGQLLVSIIGYGELFEVYSRSFLMEEFWALTIVLFAFALIVAELIGQLEKRIEYYAGVRQ